VLDVGCGIGWRSAMLARLVTPGPLIGVDVHEELLVASSAHAREAGLTNTSFLCCDAARNPLPDGRFDLVTCVAVLWTLPDPEAVVTEMVRLAKPGAVLHSREPDAGSLPIRHPPLPPEVARVNEAFFAFVERHGGSQFMGRRLFDLYTRAGLQEVRLTVRTSYQTGPSDQPATNWDIIEQWESELVEQGYLAPGELAAARAIEADYLCTPGLFELYCSYEVTGRRPE
jgi:SAM-dependent methyltransferase